MSGIKGKVAVVTASTQGIGFAIAKRLAQAEASVVVSSRNQSKVDDAVKELKSNGLQVAAITCHVGNAEDRKRLLDFTLKTYGKIDILVSNAAANPHVGNFLDITEEMWDKIFDINVKSAFLLTKEFLPHMNDGGSIIYISSVAAYVPVQAILAYGLSKTALVGLTKSMAQTVAGRGIRVNCVAPGIIKTNFGDAIVKGKDPNDPRLKIAMKRFGTPDECAGLVVFLCSNDATYTSGETYAVSGGLSARL